MISNKTIGKNLKAFREANGFTQDAVADFLAIKREMISYYENGAREAPFDVLERLSDLYGAGLDNFYSEDENVVKENAACAFRTTGAENSDLEIIANFKAIVKNYLKMNRLLKTK